MAESAEVEAYLAKHHIRDFVRDLLMALARQQPAEPLAFVKACGPFCLYLVFRGGRFMALAILPLLALVFVPYYPNALSLLRVFVFYVRVTHVLAKPWHHAQLLVSAALCNNLFALVILGLRQQNDVSQGQCGGAYCGRPSARREAGRSRCTSNFKFSYTQGSSERFSHDRRRRMC